MSQSSLDQIWLDDLSETALDPLTAESEVFEVRSEVAGSIDVAMPSTPPPAAWKRSASSGTPTTKSTSRMPVICSRVSLAAREASTATATSAATKLQKSSAHTTSLPPRWRRSLSIPAAAPSCAYLAHSAAVKWSASTAMGVLEARWTVPPTIGSGTSACEIDRVG
eukprot:scaffold57443_cov60-Phaeocystis_antarctica.AAC.1